MRIICTDSVYTAVQKDQVDFEPGSVADERGMQVCSNIYAENIDVVSPSGYNEAICTNVRFSSFAIVCDIYVNSNEHTGR